MILRFLKYEGTGNDFILADNRNNILTIDASLVSRLCDRNFGIGADGMIFLSDSESKDFSMLYYNSDGNEVSMCGNGGRCITAFAKKLGIIENKTRFMAKDGEHTGIILSEENNTSFISLSLKDVSNIEKEKDHSIIDTGVPHYIKFVEDINSIDVLKEGRKIRYSRQFIENGINVDFVEIRNEEVFVRTYERGVENETLSCGTGVTAAAIAAYEKLHSEKVIVRARGGNLAITFRKAERGFKDIMLTGPVNLIFQGEIKV